MAKSRNKSKTSKQPKPTSKSKDIAKPKNESPVTLAPVGRPKKGQKKT